MWIHNFEVKSMHREPRPFPLDMLRYDHCYPTSQEQMGIIVLTFRTVPTLLGLEPIKMQNTSSDRFWKPTDKRWKSFGWIVWSKEDPIHIP